MLIWKRISVIGILGAIFAATFPTSGMAAKYVLDIKTSSVAQFHLKCTLVGGSNPGKEIYYERRGSQTFDFDNADGVNCRMWTATANDFTVTLTRDNFIIQKALVPPQTQYWIQDP